MKRILRDHSRLAAWAGIIAPFCFVLVFSVEGWLRPGYNAMSSFVSALSLGPRGWIQIINFLIFGGLLALFSRGVAAEFEEGKASKWGPILLAAIALLYFISGPFVMDPQGTPSLEGSLHGTVHGLAGGIVFLLMPIVIFVFYRRFHLDPDWQMLQWWSLVLGIICSTATLFFTIVSKNPSLTETFKAWLGLIQRSVIVPFMLWVFIFGTGLLKRINTK